MEQIISRCGNICSECPWSMFMRKKIPEDDWDTYSNQVKNYTGFKPIKYEWEGCIGCSTPEEELPKHPFFNFLKKCRTRKCSQHNEIPNCAYCARFPCANTVSREDFSQEKISAKLGREISADDYEKYIRMFDSMGNLKKIRSGLDANQIKKPKLVNFQKKIPERKFEFKNDKYNIVYEKLFEIAESNLGIKGIDTISGQERYKDREKLLWRLIWIFGRFGTIIDNDLHIDSTTLYENRKPISLPRNEGEWKIILDVLTEFNINSELEIKTDKLYTPGGYMRPKVPGTNEAAYSLKFKLGGNLQPYPFFKILNEMILGLENNSGKRAFSNFKKLNFKYL